MVVVNSKNPIIENTINKDKVKDILQRLILLGLKLRITTIIIMIQAIFLNKKLRNWKAL